MKAESKLEMESHKRRPLPKVPPHLLLFHGITQTQTFVVLSKSTKSLVFCIFCDIIIIRKYAPVAQRTEQRTSNPLAAGSTPAGRAIMNYRGCPFNRQLKDIHFFYSQIFVKILCFIGFCRVISCDWFDSKQSSCVRHY